ncbi:hypothetical protein ALC56_07047 [Trachymyrmex septentrionalis]|uniref:Uncharacterized protein n=1 Tax=Trachymyrmex septentrionalis TaxID=34720 RepID=A0A195FEV1_9HYME|nr:hypothetical protein ALC56_07047 [Trachymyrmex septentrionalis]
MIVSAIMNVKWNALRIGVITLCNHKRDVRTKRTGCSPDLAHPCSPSARVEFLESQADCTRTSFVLSVELTLDGAKLRIL